MQIKGVFDTRNPHMKMPVMNVYSVPICPDNQERII
jgi:hypothetical protein